MISTRSIEIAIANWFGIRTHIIVPNLSWGFGMHECDLFIIRESGYAIEVEIKRSISDFRNDFLKGHGHKDKRIKELYYAFTEEIIEECSKEVPEDCGILLVFTHYGRNKVRLVRSAKKRKESRALTQEEIFKVMRLGCMRIWKLKANLDKK